MYEIHPQKSDQNSARKHALAETAHVLLKVGNYIYKTLH
jgi:hypothetical protein